MTIGRNRGQTLPLWTVATLTSLVLMYFAINYGNVLRWQIRAQSAADSAAQAVASLQADSWNEMDELLYASDIEEFRLRKLLDNLVNVAHESGGCTNDNSANSCVNAWNVLLPLFQASVSRYSADVQALDGVSRGATFSALYAGPPSQTTNCSSNSYPSTTCSDAYRLLAQINTGHSAPNCLGTISSPSYAPINGDCAFVYQIVAVKKRLGLLGVSEDAFNTATPEGGSGQYGISHPLTTLCGAGFNPTCSNSGLAPMNPGDTPYYVGSGVSTFYYDDELFAPAEVEVAVCAAVPPVIPNFAGLHTPTFYAIARAASTNLMVEQDWLQPGEFQRQYNPMGTTTKYQDVESYSYLINSAGGIANPDLDFYDLTYGGLDYYDTNASNLHQWNQSGISKNDFETLLGWWAPIPVAPFSGTVAQSTIYSTSTGCVNAIGSNGTNGPRI